MSPFTTRLALIACGWLVILATAAARPASGATVWDINGASGVNTVPGPVSTGAGLVINQVFGVEYLVVGGGGAGGNAHRYAVAGGGGGAGGLQKYVGGEAGNSGLAPLSVTATLHTITVGAGGIAPAQTDSTSGIGLPGGNGVNSSFVSITAVGGGGGGGAAAGAPSVGGSGGGGSRLASGISGAAGEPGQGNAGGNGNETDGNKRAAGGGGGAGTAGTNAAVKTGGNGGAGIASSITGASITYAGGGGGGATETLTEGTPNAIRGTGGVGGGGNGGAAQSLYLASETAQAGFNGTANSGGGGGGAANTFTAWNATGRGGSGGSGIVVLSYDGSVLPGLSATVAGGSPGSVAHADLGGRQVYSFTIGSSTTSGTFSFDMSAVNLDARLATTIDGLISGSGDLTYNGPGRLTLTAANTYTGATTVSGGTLALGSAASLASPVINVASGGRLDVSALTGGLSLGTGQRLGGRGTLVGDVTFGSGSQLAFDPLGPLVVSSGTLAFAADFGVANLFGIDWDSVALNTPFPLISTSQTTFGDLANFGFENRTSVGSIGRQAYFESGSLQVIVVPEPAGIALLASAATGLAACRLGRLRYAQQRAAA